MMVEANQEEQEEKIEEVASERLPLFPLNANVIRVVPNDDFLLLDFGFVAPSYSEPYDFQDTQIARLCLGWESGKRLMGELTEVIEDHFKPKTTRRRRTTRSNEEK